MPFRIVDWDKHYETFASRQVDTLTWLGMPLKRGTGYRRLVRQKDGESLFGAWVVIAQCAAQCYVRGLLCRPDGKAYRAIDIAVLTDFSVETIARTMELVRDPAEEIEWIEEISDEEAKSMIAAKKLADEQRAAARKHRKGSRKSSPDDDESSPDDQRSLPFDDSSGQTTDRSSADNDKSQKNIPTRHNHTIQDQTNTKTHTNHPSTDSAHGDGDGDGWDLKIEDLKDTARLIAWMRTTKLVPLTFDFEQLVLAASERAQSAKRLGKQPIVDRVAYFVSIVRDRNWKVITDTDRDRAKLRYATWSRSVNGSVVDHLNLKSPEDDE